MAGVLPSVRPAGVRSARLTAAIAAAVLAAVLTGCGSSGPDAGSTSHPSASQGVAAYVHCLSSHHAGGAHAACSSLRPPGGLRGPLTALGQCLRSRGITVPAVAPGSGLRTIWTFLAGLDAGSTAQRSALHACLAVAEH